MRVIIYLEDLGPSSNTNSEEHSEIYEVVKDEYQDLPINLPDIPPLDEEVPEENCEKVYIFEFFF